MTTCTHENTEVWPALRDGWIEWCPDCGADRMLGSDKTPVPGFLGRWEGLPVPKAPESPECPHEAPR